MASLSTPSICGSFLGSRRALLAFTWTMTTILTLCSFFVAIGLVISINSHYRYLQRVYDNDDDDVYNRYLENNNNQGENDNQHSGDQNNQNQDQGEFNWVPILASTSSTAMNFVALYTFTMALGLTLYGSTAIVGFTSLRGVYIAPCFPHKNRMKIGIFGGAVVVFANLLLLNAVIFGEFKVVDYRDDHDREEMNEPYAVERIATVLAVTCMFLSVLYATFAVLLFLTYAAPSDLSTEAQDNHDGGGFGDKHQSKPQGAEYRAPRQQFITIEATGVSERTIT